MKTKYILPIFALTAGLASCDEDFDNWAAPQGFEEEPIAEGIEFTIEGMESLNLATYEEDSVKLFTQNLSMPEGAEFIKYEAYLSANNAKKDIAVDSDARASVEDIASALASFYGRKPVERTADIVVTAYAKVCGIVTKVTKSSTITVTLEAPVIEEAYYLIGDYPGWNFAVAADTKFNHTGDNVYDSPVFTITVPAPTDEKTGERKDFYFRFVPQSLIDANKESIEAYNALEDKSTFTGEWVWDGTVGAAADNDENLEDKLTIGSYCVKMSKEDGAKFYKISLNMMEYKYTVTPVSYANYMYYAGDYTGWQANAKPLLHMGDGLYEGHYYIKLADNSSTWGFKITDGIGDDAKNWYGVGENPGTMVLGGGNCSPEADGFYTMKYNMTEETYSLEPITVISLIGSAVNGDTNWGTDADMTFNVETGVWEITTDLTAGEYKFRANHDWALSWGGADDALTAKDGANRSIAEGGNYTITFAPNANGIGVASVKKN